MWKWELACIKFWGDSWLIAQNECEETFDIILAEKDYILWVASLIAGLG